MTPDIDAVARLVEDIAAAEIMPRFARLRAEEVRDKGRGDLVTVADEAAEARLAAALTALVPGSTALGEEAAAADPGLLRRLGQDAPVWVIDPIDGTANFAEGLARFVVMVAYVRRGGVLAAWIHDPVAGATAAASAGEGAWLGDRRLRVAPPPEILTDMSGTLLAGFYGRRDLGRRLQARGRELRTRRSLRCAGLEYLRLAKGEMHFSLFTRLMPWDHAPGVLIHAEAGGHAGYLEGGAYEPARLDASGLLLAPDAASWRTLRDFLLGG